MGVPYLLPVRPIEHYRPTLDEQMVPLAEVPGQDIAPWREALERLLDVVRAGPSSSAVENVEAHWDAPSGEMGRFEIRF
jgi:hypothetical protein